MDKALSVPNTKNKIFHIPNLIAALGPILLLLGSCTFPLFINGSFITYFTDFIPIWVFIVAFLPLVFIYVLGFKKRYALVSVLLTTLLFGFLIHDANKNDKRSIIAVQLDEGINHKVQLYKKSTNNKNPLSSMKIFDDRWGLGLYMFGLGVLLLPISLIGPKYKRNEQVMVSIKNGASSIVNTVKAKAADVGLAAMKETSPQINVVGIKNFKQLLLILVPSVILVLFLTRTPIPDVDAFETKMITKFYDAGYQVEIHELDIYSCEDLGKREVGCLVDLDVNIYKKNGKPIARSTISEEEFYFNHIDGEFRELEPMAFLTDEARTAINLDQLGIGLNSLLR